MFLKLFNTNLTMNRNRNTNMDQRPARRCDVTAASSLSVFKNRLKIYLFRRCCETVLL